MTSENIAISLRNVSKTFSPIEIPKRATLKEAVASLQLFKRLRRTAAFIEALKDVTFDIRRGDSVGIIGRNGSGKTSLLRLLAGIYTPSSGTVSVDGTVALLSIGVGFHPDMSGRENVRVSGLALGVSARDIEEKMDEIIDFAELRESIDFPVRTYSSGMYMRLAFSVAINVDPDILLLDEVLAVGDEAFARKCYARLQKFREKRKTVVLVTHDASALATWCDTAIWLDRGAIRAAGATSDVISAYHTEVAREKTTGTFPVTGNAAGAEESQVKGLKASGAAKTVKAHRTAARVPRELREAYAIIERSSLFNHAWYLQHNADVATAGLDPILHYLQHGEREGRAPGPYFDPIAYRRRAGHRGTGSALVHYEKHGHAQQISPMDPFSRWRQRNAPRESDLRGMRDISLILPRRPTISLIMPTYNSDQKFLCDAIDSVREQTYPYWELCIADDASTDPHVRTILEEACRSDERIKVIFREKNGHISHASNTALGLATGEFIGLLDHDDLLAPNALYENAILINKHPDANMIYSDEDKVDADGHQRDPFFKPDWCPDSLLSRMYTSHFTVYRRSIVDHVGGFRAGFEGSQDYDLALRVTELTDKIYHINKILYHWRIHSKSTAGSQEAKPYAYEAACKALKEAIMRRGYSGTVNESRKNTGVYIVRYALPEKKKISIIVPTRDHGEDVDRCMTSIFSASSYENFEVIILDNGSKDPSSKAVFERWKRKEDRVRILEYDVPFNYSKINNYAVANCSGDLVLFLNNDTKVITPDWLEAMAEQATRPPVGAVGTHLLYPDNTIQHAGIIIGMGGVAGEVHKKFQAEDGGYFGSLLAVNNYSAVTAACLMIRRSVFNEVGGFDETLAVAFNDVDFCLKVRAAGYNNIVLPHVRLYHYESKSRGAEDTDEKRARFSAEVKTMIERWDLQVWNDPCYSSNLTLRSPDCSIRE